jgi:hypothetical protein
MRNLLGYLVGICSCLGCVLQADYTSKPTPPRESIQKELVNAEKTFQDAKQMFNAWYTGPLLAPSAHILPPGYINVQPYLFLTAYYGAYTNSGSFKKTTTLFNMNPSISPILIGALSWLEFSISPQMQYNSLHHKSSFNFGDLPVGVGFGLLKETPYVPALLFGIQETFPTGKYQYLDPDKNGIDATGNGAYTTKLSLNFSKLVWWWILGHPMNFRLSLTYALSPSVHVGGFNSYGGGYGTKGEVHPGQAFGLDFGYEYSFTQHWAGALDVVYNYSAATHFTGNKGVDAEGKEAVVGGPFREQLSLAPAIEYNWSENFGFIGGLWFTVWGRNSGAFVSGVLSVTWTY